MAELASRPGWRRPDPRAGAFAHGRPHPGAGADGELARRLGALASNYHRRAAMLHERGLARWRDTADDFLPGRLPRLPLASDFRSYARDLVRRWVLTLDVLRRRGNEFREYEATGQPPLLAFDYEILIDGRELPEPVNYCLVRIVPPEGVEVDPTKRPYLIIDPRAGHGAGIGGFRQESQVGVALREGNPVYFTVFYPMPEPGQTLAGVAAAQRHFMRAVARRHPDSPKPALVGNCQGGWAAMAVAAVEPEVVGPLVLNGAPLSYWAGVHGKNPMRYLGGLAGGSWLAYLVGDLGNGHFDGAWLVQNFESLNPANTWWTKYYRLFADVDTEAERFLDFEKWWGGFVQLTAEEMRTIVDDLFVGNKLAPGGTLGIGATLDLRRVRSPIVVFCSQGDDITPPQQALNWIADTYLSAREIKAHGQTIVYIVHADAGHLGIFVSGSVVRREFTQIAGTLAAVEALPPGLYELVIDDAQPDARGLPQYAVSLHEREIADILAHDDDREDERLFRIVAAVSELNGRAYDLFVSPWVRALASAWSARLMRDLHPLRVQRTLWSDANPWLWWLPTAARFVAANVPPAAPDNPLRWVQERHSDLVTGLLDGWRDLRDAALENAFHFVYGAFDATGASERLQAGRAVPRSAADELSARALAGISEGGVPEAVVRMLLLMMKAGGSVRRETLGYVQEQLADEPVFAALDASTQRAMLTAQNIIVAYQPEQALGTLPALLPTPGARREAMRILARVLPADVGERPLLREMLDRFAELLGGRADAA